MSQFQFIDKVVDSSCATKNRCHRCSSREEGRDSTVSVPDKMVDVTVVPGHRSTSWKGRLRSPQLQIVQQNDEIPESRRSGLRLESTPVRQV